MYIVAQDPISIKACFLFSIVWLTRSSFSNIWLDAFLKSFSVSIAHIVKIKGNKTFDQCLKIILVSVILLITMTYALIILPGLI